MCKTDPYRNPAEDWLTACILFCGFPKVTLHFVNVDEDPAFVSSSNNFMYL